MECNSTGSEAPIRLRATAIFILVIFSAIAVYNVCHQEGGAVDTLVGMARRISYGALFAVGFCSASLVLRKWMGQPVVRPAAPVGTPRPPAPTPVFEAPIPQVTGRYRVVGVDHDTRFGTEEVVFADSPTNARLKVELKGVDVAAVEPA